MEVKKPTAEQMAKFKKNAQDQSLSAEVRAKFQAIVDKFENITDEIGEEPTKRVGRKPSSSSTSSKKLTKADLDKLSIAYYENEDNNNHSDNVVLLANNFGTESEKNEAKRIYDLHAKEGSLSSADGKKRQQLHLKLIAKWEKVRESFEKKTPAKKAPTSRGGGKKTATDIEKAKAEIKAKTGKTEEECEAIIEQYRALRTKAQEGKRKAEQANADNKKRVEKLDQKGDLIEGTNVKTADAVIESTAKDVAEKIEQQIEAVEDKAEKEAKAEVAKDNTIKTPKDKKEAVKEKVDEKVKKETKIVVERVVIDTSALLTSIATSLGKFDKDSQKEFLIKLRSDIDKLLAKYAFGGMTDGAVQTMNVQQSNLSSSSVNPSMFAKGGGVDGGAKIRIDSVNMDVYEDSYEEGEGSYVIGYSRDDLVGKLVNPKELVKFLSDELDIENYRYNYSILDGAIFTSKLVDEDSNTASERQKAEWKKGDLTLYSENTRIGVSIIHPTETTDEELSELTGIGLYKKGGKVKMSRKFANGGGVDDSKNKKIMESYREWVFDLRNQSYPKMSVSQAIKQATEYMYSYYSKEELIEAIKNDRQIEMFGMENTWLNALKRAKKRKMAKGGGVEDEELHYWEVSLKMPNGEIVYESVIADSKEDAEYYGELTDSANEGAKVLSVKSMGKEKYAKGGGVGKFTKIDLLVKKPYGNEEMEIAKFKGAGDAIISASALNENSPSNYEYSVRNSNKYADGGKIATNLSLEETRIIANATAKALGKDFKLTEESLEGASFDLDFKGEPYDGGSYLIFENGDVINYAVSHKPIVYNYKTKKKFADGGVVGQEIVFDDSGEENTGVIKEITNLGDYVVKADDGRTLLAQRDLDVISFGAMRQQGVEQRKKRFGFFGEGGGVKSNSKEVREKVRQHILESVYDYDENEFDNFNDASQHLTDEFTRVADFPNNLRRYPNNQKRFQDYLQGIPFHFEFYDEDIENFLNGLGINPQGKKYTSDQMWNLYSLLIWREVEPTYKSNKMAEGGNVSDLDYSDILAVLEDKLTEAVANDIPNHFENSYNAEGEEVEHQSRDGFIAYTDGGFEVRWFEYLSGFWGSGYSLPTSALDEEKERQIDYSLEMAKEYFIDQYPEIVEELGEDNINYNSLYEAGYESEAEELSEAEMENMDGTIMCELGAYYYTPNNDRGIEGEHTLRLFGLVNLESPYHRNGNLEDRYDIDITFNSIEELEEILEIRLKEITDWFNGSNYDESTDKLRISRMAKGGLTEHGLREGDKIVFDHLGDDKIDIIDRNGNKHVVDLDKGKRFAKGGKLWIDTKVKGGLKGVKPSRKNTFARQAQKRGITSGQLASRVLANPSRYKGINPKSAQLVKNMGVRKQGGSIGDILRNRRGE